MTFLKYSFGNLRGTDSSPILPLMCTFTSLRQNEAQKLFLSILANLFSTRKFVCSKKI